MQDASYGFCFLEAFLEKKWLSAGEFPEAATSRTDATNQPIS